MLSMYEAPAPFWMACCGLCCPYPAAASFDRSAESGLSGMWSSSRSIIVTIISTWASSSVPMERSRSLYLPGSRQFQPCSRYWVATVISPHCPPRISCILRAKSGSGPSGLASYCSACVCVNTGSPLRRSTRVRGHAEVLPAPDGPLVPSPGPRVPIRSLCRGPRRACEGWGQRDPFSAVGELHGEGEPRAVVVPDHATAQFSGLPLDRPQAHAREVQRRPGGPQVTDHPVRGHTCLRQREVHPARPASDVQPDRGAAAVPMGVLQQVGEDSLHARVRDRDVSDVPDEAGGELCPGQAGGGDGGLDDVPQH